MAVDDFFLPEADPADNYSFRQPKRVDAVVTPLIDGVPAFQAMEIAIAGAVTSIHMTLWRLQATTQLTARKKVRKLLHSRGWTNEQPQTWVDLLGVMAAHGVDVRIILNDFDPLLTRDLHDNAWRAYRRIVEESARRKPAPPGGLWVICSRHEHKLDILAPPLLFLAEGGDPRVKLVQRLNGLPAIDSKENEGRETRFSFLPGLWQNIAFDRTTKQFSQRSGADWEIHPISHHQKTCVIDGRIGFCGGLDITDWRADTQEHLRTILWHDIHCRVEGELAADLERNFLGRWEREYIVFNRFLVNANKTQPPFKLPGTVVYRVPPAPTHPLGPPVASGTSTAQLLRTISTASAGPVPANIRDDIELATRAAIKHAQQFIYLENQYLRDPRVADWIIDRRATVPGLAVLVVLPVAPEEADDAAARNEKVDVVTMKGMFLQRQTLVRLREELGGNVGLFSMVELKPRPSDRPLRVVDPAAVSMQVYVHSKLLIVDDRFAMIGSNNLGARSFRADTEAAIAWYDTDKVAAFRKTLWRHLLGNPSGLDAWSPASFLSRWNQIAVANQAKRGAAARTRSGFIVPHDPLFSLVEGTQNHLILDVFTEAVRADFDPREGVV